MALRQRRLVRLIVAAVSMSTLASAQGSSGLGDVGSLIVGDWTGEGIYAADYPGVGKKGEKFTTTHSCRWAAGRAAISCEGTWGNTPWVGSYWWDPVAKQVRSLRVNSGGNYDQGTISKQGPKLVWASAGSFSDGRNVEYRGETVFENNGNSFIDIGATILGGVRNEFRDTFKRVVK